MKKNAAHALGQYTALVKLGMGGGARLLMRTGLGTGLGAGAGALTAGEGNRLRGALYGGALGAGLGGLGHLTVGALRGGARWAKLPEAEQIAAGVAAGRAGTFSESTKAILDAIKGHHLGMGSGIAAAAGGGALGGYLAQPSEPEYPTQVYAPPPTTTGLHAGYAPRPRRRRQRRRSHDTY